MSYDVMVFDPSKIPCEFGELAHWFHGHMENDAVLARPAARFCGFLESVQNVFPSMQRCPEDRLEYACEYEIHENFIYMSFAYSAAKEAHDIVKRQAKSDQLGFWDVSQTFDRTFPVTLPNDRWPMLAEAEWIKYGQYFVYSYEEIRKILVQMKSAKRSSICVTDRFGNYMQAGGFGGTFVVEMRRYTDSVTYVHMRADLKEENPEADTLVQINDFLLRVPASQVLSGKQVQALFREYADGVKNGDFEIFWKKLDL